LIIAFLSLYDSSHKEYVHHDFENTNLVHFGAFTYHKIKQELTLEYNFMVCFYLHGSIHLHL
jgi:hypothetical protein